MEPSEIERKARGRAGTAPQPRVHTPQARVQHVFQLAEREIRDGNFTNARNDDKSLSRNVKRIRSLGVSSQDEHDAIAGAEAIAGVNGSGEIGIELRR